MTKVEREMYSVYSTNRFSIHFVCRESLDVRYMAHKCEIGYMKTVRIQKMIYKGLIFICDDEKQIRQYLNKMLLAHGFSVELFSDGEAVLQRLKSEGSAVPDLLLQDIQMPDISGIDVLKQVRQQYPTLTTVIMTAYGTIDSAVEAIKLGAYDYITKPFPKEKILDVLEKALERKLLITENRGLKEELQRQTAPGEIVFKSQLFREAYNLACQVASSEANILISGESGTGKELIARAIHYNSLRREQRYLSLNCAAFTDTLLESQLFGHVKGAFTGATVNNKGLLLEADGGTLFLDEIGDVSLAVQAKLLRVLQEREFIPVGSTRPCTVDVRFVAATNKNLEKEMLEGRFREDLFYRLNVIAIPLPALRERKEDIEPLALHFLGIYATRLKKKITGLDDRALQVLLEYHWPGNVRELQNIMERAVILAQGDLVTADVLPILKSTAEATAAPLAADLRATSLDELERQHIERTLKSTGYFKKHTAEILGISRKTLDRKIAAFGLMPAKHDQKRPASA